jgi:hypothetical protein
MIFIVFENSLLMRCFLRQHDKIVYYYFRFWIEFLQKIQILQKKNSSNKD